MSNVPDDLKNWKLVPEPIENRRERIAMHVLGHLTDREDAAKRAVEYANALIAELDKRK